MIKEFIFGTRKFVFDINRLTVEQVGRIEILMKDKSDKYNKPFENTEAMLRAKLHECNVKMFALMLTEIANDTAIEYEFTKVDNGLVPLILKQPMALIDEMEECIAFFFKTRGIQWRKSSDELNLKQNMQSGTLKLLMEMQGATNIPDGKTSSSETLPTKNNAIKKGSIKKG